MTVRILRRLKAAEDAESIANHIAKDSLKAAVRFVESTESTLQDLAKSPGSGSRFESLQPELSAMFFRRVKGFPNHFIFFFEHKGAIEVVRILHGAQEIAKELVNE
jgi:plasmid stabilization system protein ParE